MFPLEIYNEIVEQIDDSGTFYNMALVCKDIALLTQCPLMQCAKKRRFAAPRTEEWGYAYRLPNGVLHGPFEFSANEQQATGAWEENQRHGEWTVCGKLPGDNRCSFVCTYENGQLMGDYRPYKTHYITQIGQNTDEDYHPSELEISSGPSLAKLAIEQVCTVADFPAMTSDEAMDTFKAMTDKWLISDPQLSDLIDKGRNALTLLMSDKSAMAQMSDVEIQEYIIKTCSQ